MRKILLVLGILIVVSIAVMVVFKPEKQKIEQESKLEPRDLVVRLIVNGQARPRNRVVLSASGRVEKVFVKEGETVKKGKIVAYTSSSDRAAMLDAAKNAQERKELEDFFKPTPLQSPIDGVVTRRSMDEGQLPSQGSGGVAQELVIANDLVVFAYIDEIDIKHIAPNLNLSMRLDAYPDEKFEGIVEHVSYEATIEHGVTSYMVRINPIKRPEVLRTGMGVIIEIVTETKKDAMSIPSIFIKEGGGQKKTVIVKTGTVKKPIFETRQVITGATDGIFTEIVSGLDSNETVVVLSQNVNNKNKKRSEWDDD